ncbi:MAG: PaaI family thioesterase [Pseudomonadota bacterium]
MTVEELMEFLHREFPQVADHLSVETLRDDGLVVRLRVQDIHLRPGGTVSGPSLFMVADAGMYLALLAQIGPVALAVTTNASIDFMRKPLADKDILGDATLFKVGKRLAIGQVLLRSDGSDDIVTRSSLTYAIP